MEQPTLGVKWYNRIRRKERWRYFEGPPPRKTRAHPQASSEETPMSYNQAVKWSRKHPKGHKTPVIMSTGSGFWPSGAWLKEDYWPYLESCNRIGVEPFAPEVFYRKTVCKTHFPRT